MSLSPGGSKLELDEDTLVTTLNTNKSFDTQIKKESVSPLLVQSTLQTHSTVKIETAESAILNITDDSPHDTLEIITYKQEEIQKASDITAIKQALSFTPLIRDTLNLIQSSSDLNSIVKNTTILAEKFKEALNLIEQLPGIDISIEDQINLLDNATKRYRRQRKRHLSYLQLPIFQQIHKRSRSVSPNSPEEPPEKKLKE